MILFSFNHFRSTSSNIAEVRISTVLVWRLTHFYCGGNDSSGNSPVNKRKKAFERSKSARSARSARLAEADFERRKRKYIKISQQRNSVLSKRDP